MAKGLRFDEVRIDASGLPEPERYVARDGAQLPIRRYPAESDLHLVLLHGSGYHGRYLHPLARVLSEQSLASVHVPDLRGHGPSPTRRGDIDYEDQLEDDVSDLIASIRAEHPAARVAMGGHSSGGGLALRFAGGAHGAEVSALALLAPFLRYDAPTTRPNSGGWAQPRVPLVVAASLLNALGLHTLDAAVAIRFQMPDSARDGTETLAYTHRMNTGFAPRDYRRELAELRVPLLVLVGADDEAFVAEAYEPTVKAHAPAAEVEVLPGVSHLGLAVVPETARVLGAWLSRVVH